jgi:hypothetical protein
VSGSSLSRLRMLLSAGAVTAVGLTSCDLDPSSSAPEPTVEPSPDADQVIVLAARAELAGLIARLGNSPRTAALVSVHRTQLAALQGEAPSATAGRPPTLAQIVAREQRAAERFTRWAATSGSGDLARVLAAIAAGIRMQPVLRGVA